jgi:hypothetical protein
MMLRGEWNNERGEDMSISVELTPAASPTVLGADGTPAVRRQVNEAEAAVVQRIFQMWCPSAIRKMLRRELYAGIIVRNRRHFVKKPESNRRVSRERPKSEWLIVEQPELRIIDEALWLRVQAGIVAKAENYHYGNHPGLANRASTSLNILTGFMKCGVCGANLVIVTGRGKNGHHRYGCPQNFNRGARSNGLKERAAQLQQEIGNLAATAAQCGPTPALVKEIYSRQQELDEITRQLLSTEPDSISAEIGHIRPVCDRAAWRHPATAEGRRSKS